MYLSLWNNFHYKFLKVELWGHFIIFLVLKLLKCIKFLCRKLNQFTFPSRVYEISSQNLSVTKHYQNSLINRPNKIMADRAWRRRPFKMIKYPRHVLENMCWKWDMSGLTQGTTRLNCWAAQRQQKGSLKVMQADLYFQEDPADL